MGNASAAKTRKKAILAAIEEKTRAATEVIEKIDAPLVIDIFTGYRVEMVKDVTAKVVETKSAEDLKQKPWGILISAVKVDKGTYYETFLSLVSILPISLDVIIDRDSQSFEYDYDSFFVEDQVSVSRIITDGLEALESNLNDVIKESQRILLLYGDEVRENVNERQLK